MEIISSSAILRSALSGQMRVAASRDIVKFCRCTNKETKSLKGIILKEGLNLGGFKSAELKLIKLKVTHDSVSFT